MAVNGIDLITPTSIAHSSGSASINAGGSVTFTGVTSLSLNGVFTATYDNYVVNVRVIGSAASFPSFRLRASGVDSSTGYTRQFLFAGSTSVSGGRSSGNEFYDIGNSTSLWGGSNSYWFGPNLVQPTAVRFVASDPRDSATINDFAGTHSVSTSYDGITYFTFSGNMTGLIKVYGLVK